MNRWKGNAVTQITLDEDFIVPDTLEDMEQVILEQAHIQGENVKTQEEKITVKGKLEFQVLYRKENGGLETLGGNIPFEETVNVPGLAEGDHTGLNWILEDMKTDMINSRKLGVQAPGIDHFCLHILQDPAYCYIIPLLKTGYIYHFFKRNIAS